MAIIKISELRPAGSELFQDSESFLNELAEAREVDQVLGGFGRVVIGNSVVGNTIIGNTVNANTKNNANSVFIG